MQERKNVFSDLDTCPDNSREIPVTPRFYTQNREFGKHNGNVSEDVLIAQ